MNHNEQYKQMFPLVEIPTYSESDVLKEYDKITEYKKNTVKSWFSKKFPIIWLVLTTTVLTGMYILFFQIIFTENIELQNMFFEFKAEIVLFTLTFMLPWCMLLCPYPDWYRKTKIEHAEFNLRASLCKEQLENADEKLARQIFDYCNTYLKLT